MNITLELKKVALAASIALLASPGIAQTTSVTDPVGYITLNALGAADNVMSVPMIRDAVFAGPVNGAITATGFTVTGAAWTVDQFVFNAATQQNTYYCEFTSGPLQGLYYKIASNGVDSLTLDTEGDSLLLHALPGNPTAALSSGNSIRIRPYTRIRDFFESGGLPIIEPRPNAFTVKDDLLFPNYTSVGTNKPASLTVFYVTGTGWRATGQGNVDFANHNLRPNEAFILRRRNAASLAVTNMGSVLMNSGVTFVAGGNGTAANDSYISISRPAPVKLDDSGLRIADQTLSLIKDSPSAFARQDELLAFNSVAGFNNPPTSTYYYLSGQGWRKVGDASTTIGQTVFLEPGKAYILRKKAANAGRDWVNVANY
jgi:uncharacterized protein (TIGR02597 family)